MSLTSNVNNFYPEMRYPIPLKKYFTLSEHCSFTVEKKVFEQNSLLNPEATIPVLDRIFRHLPYSNLVTLAKTCRFFHESLSSLVHLHRMKLETKEEMDHFFTVLQSLHRTDFLPIRVLKLDPSYRLSNEQFIALNHFVPLAKQLALADIQAVDQNNINLLATRKSTRVDFMPINETTQKEAINKLNKMSSYAPEKEVEVFVNEKKTSNRIYTYNQRIFLISAIFITAFCIVCLTNIIAVFAIADDSDFSSDSKLKRTLMPLMITSIVLCVITPCIACGIVSLMTRIAERRIHRANYQVISDV